MQNLPVLFALSRRNFLRRCKIPAPKTKNFCRFKHSLRCSSSFRTITHTPAREHGKKAAQSSARPILRKQKQQPAHATNGAKSSHLVIKRSAAGLVEADIEGQNYKHPHFRQRVKIKVQPEIGAAAMNEIAAGPKMKRSTFCAWIINERHHGALSVWRRLLMLPPLCDEKRISGRFCVGGLRACNSSIDIAAGGDALHSRR